MSKYWVKSYSHFEVPFLQKFCLNVLQAGIVPRHVAFIMDGNRRWARKNNLPIKKGHIEGFKNMTIILEWCLLVGVTEITFYAFSIENFKRTKQEVDDLMDIFKKIFEYTLKNM